MKLLLPKYLTRREFLDSRPLDFSRFGPHTFHLEKKTEVFLIPLPHTQKKKSQGVERRERHWHLTVHPRTFHPCSKGVLEESWGGEGRAVKEIWETSHFHLIWRDFHTFKASTKAKNSFLKGHNTHSSAMQWRLRTNLHKDFSRWGGRGAVAADLYTASDLDKY